MALLLMFICYINLQKAKTIENTVLGVNDIGRRMDMMEELKVRKAVAIGSGIIALMFMLGKIFTR